MTKPLRIDAEADEELSAAFDWYERQREGLGLELLAAVDAAMVEVSTNPARFGPEPGAPAELGLRRALVERFPYAVVFLELPTEVRVLAFAHGRRRPAYWRARVGPK